MKTIILCALFALITITMNAQKTNLDRLPEKERNEYLLKTAYEAVMTYGPDWYRDYKEPEISSFILEYGPHKGELLYSIRYNYDSEREQMEYDYAIIVRIFANTGEVFGLFYGDGIGYVLPEKSTRATKPYVRPCPNPKP